MKTIRFEISPWLWLLGALALLIVPLPWLQAGITAAAVHELSHVLTIYLLGGRISSIRLNPGGARIMVTGLSYGREILAAFAGPAGSLMLLLSGESRLAICGLTQGLFNLLPVYPMDGGRILYCLTALFFTPETGERIRTDSVLLTAGVLLGCGIYCSVIRRFGPIPIVLALLILIKAEKTSCKEGLKAVQ